MATHNATKNGHQINIQKIYNPVVPALDGCKKPGNLIRTKQIPQLEFRGDRGEQRPELISRARLCFFNEVSGFKHLITAKYLRVY